MKNESLQHFQTVCELSFQFMVDDFNFSPEPNPKGEFVNPYQFRLSNGEITLVVEGISYGADAMISFEDKHNRSVGISCLKPDWEPFGKRKKKRKKNQPNQDQQISQAAEEIKVYCKDILSGKYDHFNEVGDRINNIMNRFKEN